MRIQVAEARRDRFPSSTLRRYLEPRPVVLVTSAHDELRNIMTGAGTRLSDSRHHLLAA
jgi:hypothetical protein